MAKNIVIIALLVVIFLLLIKSCKERKDEGEILQFADTSTHRTAFINPPVDSQKTVDTIEILKTIYKDRWKMVFDTIKVYVEDSTGVHLNPVLCDSLAVERNSSGETGDTLVKISWQARYTGYLNSLDITYKHNIPEIRMPPPRRMLSAGAIGNNKSFSPVLLYTDKAKRNWIGGYDFVNKTATIGATLPIIK